MRAGSTYRGNYAETLETRTQILYIDDEIIVRKTLSVFLERCGLSVMQAESGEEGLDKFRTHNPSLVLADLKMPGISGLDVLEKVTEESSETPVIIISGAGMMKDVIEAIRLGAYDFITKPIDDLAILENTVKHGLEWSKLTRENREYLQEGMQ